MEKGLIIETAERLKELYIDEWGDEPTCVQLHPMTIEAFKTVGITDTLIGLKIVSTMNAKNGEILFGA